MLNFNELAPRILFSLGLAIAFLFVSASDNYHPLGMAQALAHDGESDSEEQAGPVTKRPRVKPKSVAPNLRTKTRPTRFLTGASAVHSDIRALAGLIQSNVNALRFARGLIREAEREFEFDDADRVSKIADRLRREIHAAAIQLELYMRLADLESPALAVAARQGKAAK